MLSVGIQESIGAVGGTKFAAGSGVVDSEWNGDGAEEAIRTTDLNSALISGDGVGPGAWTARCS